MKIYHYDENPRDFKRFAETHRGHDFIAYSDYDCFDWTGATIYTVDIESWMDFTDKAGDVNIIGPNNGRLHEWLNKNKDDLIKKGCKFRKIGARVMTATETVKEIMRGN
jgi:hypothetical protein